MERTAEGDVEFLHAAADGEERDAAADSAADEAKGNGVAVGVLGGAFGVRGAAVEFGLDVAAAAGEEDAIEAGEEGVDVGFHAVGRDEDGDRAAEAVDGADVGVAGGVVGHGKEAEGFGAAGDADEGFDGHG